MRQEMLSAQKQSYCCQTTQKSYTEPALVIEGLLL